MLNKMKIIAVFIAIICVFSQFVVLAAETLVEDYTQIDADQKAIDYLVLLGVINEDEASSFTSDAKITKGEATYLIVKSLGLYELAKQTEIYKGFSDLKSSQKYAEVVSIAVNKGVLSGGTGGIINLDSEITLEQSAKMFVAALGYDFKAQYLGGYPAGYMMQAADIKILKGVNTAAQDLISKKAFMRMLYNSFNVNVASQSSFSAGDIVYDSEGTMESLYLKAYDLILEEGIVQATKQTNILNQDELKDNDVIIGGIKMDLNNTKIWKYIGYDVKYVAEFKEAYNVPQVLRFSISDKNKVQYLKKKNEPYYSDGKINYIDEITDKEYNMKLSPGVIFIYNNRKLTSFSLDMLDFSDGAKLINNDGNTDIDIVTWTKSQSFIVDNVSVANEMLYLKDSTYAGSSTINFDEDDKRSLVVRNMNDEAIDWRDIKSKDAIAVIESLDKVYLEIVLLPPSFTGRITEMEVGKSAVINGTVYDISSQLGEVLLGKFGKFFTNEKGELFRFETTTSEYVYLINKSTPIGLASNVKIKIYDNITGIKIYEVDSSVKVDDINYSSKIFDAIPTAAVAATEFRIKVLLLVVIAVKLVVENQA